MRSIIPRLEALLPEIREKLRLDGNKRFMLLLVFFNALLIAILLLSVRNNEISYRIINVEESITRIVQRRETLVASQTRIVFITATPTYNAIAAATSTPTPTQAPPTATQTPTRRPSSTPQPTNTPTAQPTETAVPTQTSVPTATSVLPTPTETAIATPTWTSVPPTPVPPTQPPPPTATPTNTPTNTPTATPTNTPTNTPTATPDIDSLTLSAVPPNIFATGISTTTISADVRDSGGFAVSDGTIVTFNTSSGSFPSGTSTTAPTSGGIAQAILTSSTTAGIAIVDASAVAASDSITVTFDPGGPATVVLTASPSSIPADGVTTTTLQATVTDAYGNPVADGTTVDFVTTLGTLSALSATTSGGIATVTLSSTNAGQADVTASSGTPADTVTVNLTHLLQITKVIDRADAPAGSTRTYTITVQNNTTGGVPAEVTVVSDTMAAGFGYVGGSTISPGFGEPTINGQALTWTPGAPPYNLAAGASFSLSFQVTTNVPAGPYWNNASVQGNNFATISTGSTAQVTLQSPVLGPMSPNAGCNDVAVPVTMVGNYFSPGATARLGTWDLGATWTSETLLNGTVPVDIPVGVYDLTVTNPGGASSTLVGAYTAQDCSSLDTTLESGYLATIGREVGLSSELGDNDSIQELFLEVPASTPGPIYIRVFDPDCGGTLDRQAGFDWNTPFTYTVYGAGGTQLLTQSFGENPATDGLWYNLGSFAVSSGELRGSSRVFRLRIEGGPEPPFPLNTLTVDTNLYNVAVSTSDVANVSPPGARIFAYSWTYLIPQAEWMTPSRMYPYVDGGVSTLIQHNFDYDNTAAGTAGIDVLTPLRTLTGNDSDVSGDAAEVTSSFSPIAGEENTTWTISVWAEPTGGLTDNIVIFWATDQGGRTLALFARSTNLPPPP